MADWHSIYLHERSEIAPFEEFIDFQVLEYKSDIYEVTLSFKSNREFANILGTVHGGVILSIMDQALGVAALFSANFDSWFLTMELKNSFFNTVSLDTDIQVKARVINLGGKTAFVEGEILGETGQILAKSSATMYRKFKA